MLNMSLSQLKYRFAVALAGQAAYAAGDDPLHLK